MVKEKSRSWYGNYFEDAVYDCVAASVYMPVTIQEQKAFPQLDTLSPLEQFILQFLAVLYEPVSESFLSSCLGRADLPFPDSHRPEREDIQSALTHLRELDSNMNLQGKF